MPAPIIIKINLKKIRQDWCFKNDNASYPDLVMYENDQVDQYGNSHVVKQSPPREQRGQERPIIVGNGKYMPQKAGGSGAQQPRQQQRAPQRPAPQEQSGDWDDDSVPF